MTTTAQNVRSWNGLSIPAAGKYSVDTAHTTIGFVAKHMMVSKVRGRFNEFTGSLDLADDPTQSAITVSVNTGSIETSTADRDAHLRSADFFDAENSPEMTFRSTSIKHVDGNEFVVTGDLLIRGVSKPVDLEATFEGTGTNPWGVQVIGFSASAEIDREAWGLTWNAALETGGVMVSKKIKIEIDAEFNPAQ
jgi:polyisoprenoid-binding protein YceI